MKKLTTVAAGAAIAASLATGVNAAENPFGMQTLESGYNVAMSEGMCGGDKGQDGKCGEAKCGEAKCGAKAKEAKCGEAKCGAKAKEAKCGEAKCGASK